MPTEVSNHLNKLNQLPLTTLPITCIQTFPGPPPPPRGHAYKPITHHTQPLSSPSTWIYLLIIHICPPYSKPLHHSTDCQGSLTIFPLMLSCVCNPFLFLYYHTQWAPKLGAILSLWGVNFGWFPGGEHSCVT